MGKTLIKWLVAIGIGAAAAALQYLGSAPPPELGDAGLTTIIMTVLARIVGWVGSKVPTAS